MQKLYSTLAAILLSLSTLAQADLSVSDIHISSDSMNRVPLSVVTGLGMTVYNVDTGIALPPGDSLWVELNGPGITLAQWVYLDSGLQPMASHAIYFGAANATSLDTNIDTFSLVATVTHLNDTIDSNDWLTAVYVHTADLPNDWSVSNIDVIAPANLDSFDLDNGTNMPPPLSSVNVSLSNDGHVNYVRGTRLDYEVFIGSDVHPLYGFVNEASIGTGAASVRSVTNQAALPLLPDSVGSYELCATVFVATDTNASNDTYCHAFALVDNYDPDDPANWPQGLEEVTATWFSVQLRYNVLTIVPDEAAAVRIFDLSGQVVASASMNERHNLDTSQWPSGIYFVQLMSATGKSSTAKLVRP